MKVLYIGGTTRPDMAVGDRQERIKSITPPISACVVKFDMKIRGTMKQVNDTQYLF